MGWENRAWVGQPRLLWLQIRGVRSFIGMVFRKNRQGFMPYVSRFNGSDISSNSM